MRQVTRKTIKHLEQWPVITPDITLNKQTQHNAGCILATVLLIKIYAAIISNVFRRTCLFLFITYYS